MRWLYKKSLILSDNKVALLAPIFLLISSFTTKSSFNSLSVFDLVLPNSYNFLTIFSFNFIDLSTSFLVTSVILYGSINLFAYKAITVPVITKIILSIDKVSMFPVDNAAEPSADIVVHIIWYLYLVW